MKPQSQHSRTDGVIRALPQFEALDAKGHPYMRPARVVGELPTGGERVDALHEAGPAVAAMLRMPLLRPIRFGMPIGLAFMTRAQMRKHPKRAFLQRLGDDLPLGFCESYQVAQQSERDWSASPYRLALMQRALARTDQELYGHRKRYEDTARRIAAALIGAGAYPLPEQHWKRLL